MEQAEFDLVVVDEAHRMSASWFSGELKASKRFELGELLSERTRHFLLMTATPHNGKEEDFQTFLSLLDRDRFAGPGGPTCADRSSRRADAAHGEGEAGHFRGATLVPERIAQTATYRLSPSEQSLYEEVTEYVRNGMNLADRLEGKRKNTVGFALTVLQRRLASSPEAIFQSLRRRTDRLERTRADLFDNVLAPPRDARPSLPDDDDGYFDIDELGAADLEDAEEELVDAATRLGPQRAGNRDCRPAPTYRHCRRKYSTPSKT